MAESAKKGLSDDIETLRHDVLTAGVLNAKALQESAESHVANLGRTLPASPELDDASFQAINSIIAFARLLYGQAQISESEEGRHRALARIEHLARLVGKSELPGAPAV